MNQTKMTLQLIGIICGFIFVMAFVGDHAHLSERTPLRSTAFTAFVIYCFWKLCQWMEKRYE